MGTQLREGRGSAIDATLPRDIGRSMTSAPWSYFADQAGFPIFYKRCVRIDSDAVAGANAYFGIRPNAYLGAILGAYFWDTGVPVGPPDAPSLLNGAGAASNWAREIGGRSSYADYTNLPNQKATPNIDYQQPRIKALNSHVATASARHTPVEAFPGQPHMPCKRHRELPSSGQAARKSKLYIQTHRSCS